MGNLARNLGLKKTQLVSGFNVVKKTAAEQD